MSLTNRPWLHIRNAVTDDVLGLHGLYTRHMASGTEGLPQDLAQWTATLSQIVADPNHYLLVGEVEDKIVATITLLVIPNLTHNLSPYALLENLVTHEAYRKFGYATVMIKKACKIAKMHDCYKIMFMTRTKKDGESRMFARCGFKVHDKLAYSKIP